MIAFKVAGIDIRHSFDFSDPAVPGGIRRVMARWATPRQMQMDGRTSAEDVAKVIAKVGDPDALLWDHRDAPEPADAMPDNRAALVRHAIADMQDEVAISAETVAERARSLAGLDESSLPTLRRIAAEQLRKMFDPAHTG